MPERFQGLIDVWAAESEKFMIALGGLTGFAFGVDGAIEHPPVSAYLWIMPSGWDIAFELFMVFLCGMMGALGGVVLKWMLQSIQTKSKKKRK